MAEMTRQLAERTNDRSLAERIPDLPPPEVESNSNNTNLVTTLLRRWPLLLLGIILGMIGGFAYYLTSQPVYESKAQILIIKRDISLLVESSRLSYVEDYVSTQQTLIKSKKVMRAAAEKLKEIRLENPLPDDINVRTEALIGTITVTRDRDSSTGLIGSNILNMSLKGSSPTDTKRILDHIISAYQAELTTVYDERTEQDIKTISKLIDQNQQSLNIALAKYTQLMIDYQQISSEEPQQLQNRISMRQTKLDNESDILARIQLHLNTMKNADAEPAVRREIMNNIMSDLRGAVPFSIELGDPTTQLNSPETLLKSLEIELEKELLRYGENHQRIQELRSKIKSVKELMGKDATSTGSGGSFNKWDSLFKKLSSEKESREVIIAKLSGELKTLQQTWRQASGLIVNIKTEQEKKERLDKEMQLNTEKLGKFQATKNQGGYQASPISDPSEGVKVAPRLMQSILIFAFLGTLAGIGLALAFEFTDKSFRSPAEIRRRLGLPVVGHIPPIRVGLEPDNPLLEGKAIDMEPVIVTHLRPKSIEAEAYRGVRTQLYFSTQGAGHQVIQVTSPNPGDGKSTLASNLAVSIAQSGKTVILVDCDFRKPRIHKIFHIDKPDVGLASAITGDCDLGAAIRTSSIENLSILPCGPRPQNPAELLTSPEFVAMLERLRQMFDFVIVDTPPVLAVSDPAVVAPRVDGVLLVFRMTKKARPTAERAREQLAALGANVLGVIVNGTGGTKDEGYGYGYGYNYGYGYQYQYQYEYEYADNYTDDNLESPSSYGDLQRPELPPARP